MYLYIYLYGTWLIHTKKNICNKPYVFIYILIHHTSSVWTSRTSQKPSRCYFYNITWLHICKIDYTVLLYICNRIRICTHLPYLQYTTHLHTFAKSERHYTFSHIRHIYNHIYNTIHICTHLCHISNTLRICTHSPHLQYTFSTSAIISTMQYTFAHICAISPTHYAFAHIRQIWKTLHICTHSPHLQSYLQCSTHLHTSVPHLQYTTHLHTFAKSERHYTFAPFRHIYNTLHMCYTYLR